MKILMTTDTIGGVWTYSVELIRGLEPNGVQVVLATMGAPLSPAQWEDVRHLSNVEVAESGYKLEWMEEPWEDVRRAGEWLMEIERDTLPDIIHLNGYAHGSLPWNAPVLVVGHSCVLSWWESVKGEPAPGEWERYRQEVSAGLRAASLVLAPTHAMLDMLDRHYGPFTRSGVAPNGRSVGLFPPGRKEPMVLTAGRLWDEAKNIKLLEQAAKGLEWPVHVAGEDKHPNGGRTEYENMKLLGRLSQPELAVWFNRASVYALPAKYEPFGLSALEAGLAGCALVLGDIATLREVWEDSAVYVPPDDPDRLQEAVNGLIADPARLTAMASAARRRAFNFSTEKMAERYLAAYQYMVRAKDTAGMLAPYAEDLK